MEKKINKNIWMERIIWIFLFLCPIFDVITSFSIHYFGGSMPIILGIKVLFLAYLTFLTVRFSFKKCWYFLFLGVYFLFFFFLMFLSKGYPSFYLEAQNLFRTFFFPISIFCLFSLHQKEIFHVKRNYLVYLLFLYLLFLVVPELLHVGFSSYAHSKVGGLGWFYSTNEIGGILAILGPFFFSYLKNKAWFIQILAFAFYLAGIFVIGTKVPVLAFLITIFLFWISFLWKLIRVKEWKKVFFHCLCSIVGILGFGIVLFSSSFYENIKIHLDFLEIKQVRDLMTFHHIDHFVFSERLSFLMDTQKEYNNSSLPSKLLGIGIVIYEKEEPISMKMVEMDYFDIFYHYGILGFLLVFLPFFVFPFKRKYCFEEKISIFFILLLALFSGHILVSPSVSALVSLIVLPKEKEVEK